MYSNCNYCRQLSLLPEGITFHFCIKENTNDMFFCKCHFSRKICQYAKKEQTIPINVKNGYTFLNCYAFAI